MTRKPRLTDLQLVLLSSAAQRPDGMLLPPPDTIRAKGKILERSLTKMRDLGLIEECPARTADQAWRNDTDGRPIALRITAVGRGALGLDDDPADVEDTASPECTPSNNTVVPVASGDIPKAKDPVEAEPTSHAAPVAPSVKPGTKQARLVDQLSRPGGASIADLGALLGWQLHTVRAALTGLRKKGYQITNAKDATGVAVYRATAPVEVIDDAA
jgi:hypothetical protein